MSLPRLYQILVGMVAPQVRLELTTLRLTAECSAIELLRIIFSIHLFSYVLGAGKTFVPPAPLGSRQLPTLPSRSQLSTISVWRLNFCVRYGYRWCPPAIVTGNFSAGKLLSRSPLPAPSKLHSNRVDPQTFTLPNLPSLPFALSAASALSLPPLPSPSP